MILGSCNLIRLNQTNSISSCLWCQNILLDTSVAFQCTQGKVQMNLYRKMQHSILTVPLQLKQLWAYSTEPDYWTITEQFSLTIISGNFLTKTIEKNNHAKYKRYFDSFLLLLFQFL